MIDDLSIVGIARLIRNHQLSPVEVVRDALTRMSADARFNAYVTVTAGEALAAAKLAEREIRAGIDRGPLHGLPFALKDNIDTAGIRTTAGTPALYDRRPPRSAAAWARLARAGAVLVAKTNLHELALRAPSPLYGAVRNPYDPARAAGGSSSGSAVAVAARHVVGALGTDTGGSVLQPASFCGVVGIKPGRSAISRRGVIPLAPSLDAVGLFARDPDDARTLLNVLARTKTNAEPRFPLSITVATPDAVAGKSVRDALAGASGRLASEGHVVRERQLPDQAWLRSLHQRILAYEAYREHRRLLPSVNPLVAEVLAAGAAISRTQYQMDLRDRRRILHAMPLLETDIIVMPTTPDVAPILDSRSGRGGDPALLVRWTVIGNVLDLPSVSVPVALSAGLPIGIQLIGRIASESELLAIARLLYVRLTPPAGLLLPGSTPVGTPKNPK